MSRRIAILGASGSVGSALAIHILRSNLLEPADRLLLVGHGVHTTERKLLSTRVDLTERKLLSTRVDLMDAFDDERIGIEVVPDVSDVEADIVIVAAGATISADCPTRRDLGTMNRPVFERIADQCVNRLSRALFIAVSNPVELAVEIFSFAVDGERVIGMGAQQDSMRFARAIAADLGISRHEVRATVMGEHGQAMVPLWRSVELLSEDARVREQLAALRVRSGESPLAGRVAALRGEVSQLLTEERIAEAYGLARDALLDARIFVEPFITVHCMHSTPNATANATLQCLAAALADDRRRVHGQVALREEASGLRGVCGIPLTLGMNGWRGESLDWLDPDEASAVKQSADSIEQFVSEILIEAVRTVVPNEALLAG